MKRILLSRSTVMVLLGLLMIWSMTALLVPQTGAVSPEHHAQWREANPAVARVIDVLHLDRVFSSELFLVTAALLLIVLCYAVLQLLRTVLRGDSRRVRFVEGRYFPHLFHLPVRGPEAMQLILEEARRRGYRSRRLSDALVVLQKNRFGRWGTVILHGGMVLIVLCGVGTKLFEQRGFVQLMERDTFFGTGGEFLAAERGVLASRFTPDLYLCLDRVNPEYYPNGELRALSSSVRAGEGRAPAAETTIGINAPVDIEGVTVYQSVNHGYTLGLRYEKDGISIPVYFSLDHPDRRGKPSTGRSDFPTTDLMVTLRFLPGEDAAGTAPKNPLLHLRFERDNGLLATASLEPGGTVPLEGGSLTFVDVRRWAGFILVRDPVVPWVFLAFALILAGITCVYVFPVRDIYLELRRVDGASCIHVGGVARREKALFAEEFRGLMESIYLHESVIDVGSELVEV